MDQLAKEMIDEQGDHSLQTFKSILNSSLKKLSLEVRERLG